MCRSGCRCRSGRRCRSGCRLSFVRAVLSCFYIFWCSSSYLWAELSEDQAAEQTLPAVCLFGARDYERDEKAVCYVLDKSEERASLNIPSYLNDKLSLICSVTPILKGERKP